MGLFKKKNEPTVIGENSSRDDSNKVGFFKKVGGFLKKHIKLIIILCIIVGVVLYFRHKAQAQAQLLEAEANKPVTATVEKMDLTDSVHVTGTLKANETAVVTSTLGGTGVTGVKVKKVKYKVGDYVEKGSVVVEFDGDDYSRKIAELSAQYDISNTESAMNIEDMQKQIDETQKEIEEKKKWLDDNKDIYDNLKDAYEKYEKYKDIDPAVVNRWQRESAAAMAKAEPVSIELYEAAQKEIEKLEETIRTTQNKITLAQMNQNYATTYTQVDAYNDVYESMDKTTVSAPISGYILSMNVDEGNNYSQGSTVFTIADTSGFTVEATANEYTIAKLAQGYPAAVKFEATGDEEFEGEVTFVAVASEASVSDNSASAAAAMSSEPSGGGGGATPSYKVKIAMTGTDDRLRVGMTAKADVILASAKNVLAVPYDCVQAAEDGSFFVTVINKDGSEDNVVVTKGLESEYYVEVSGEGLKEGMTIKAIVEDGDSTDMMDYLVEE
ncbi:MAG: efflux RND transporter periplasmic adaptor subunit [Pseudobutyrivibrio sp.]|nr:efflux RND transporter periplasmic adaptor subunit [Pseudobutyrivibrio sp.]